MNLKEALQQIASQFRFDAEELIVYATEDDIGGYHPDPAVAKWPIGSLFHQEGQVLYALARAIKPGSVLELGTYHGCSAAHILSALKANKTGQLVCVDNAHDPIDAEIGHLIPDNLRTRGKTTIIKIHNWDYVDWLESDKGTYDLVFEDGLHSSVQVEAAWRFAREHLNPGGIIISHDAEHFIVGADVRTAISAAGYAEVFTYLIAPSDCGLAMWRNGIE